MVPSLSSRPIYRLTLASGSALFVICTVSVCTLFETPIFSPADQQQKNLQINRFDFFFVFPLWTDTLPTLPRSQKGATTVDNDNGDSDDQHFYSFDRSLLHDAIEASSVDHESQNISQTLPVNCRLHRTFWSSRGSDTEFANEWAIYQLKSAPFIHQLHLAEQYLMSNQSDNNKEEKAQESFQEKTQENQEKTQKASEKQENQDFGAVSASKTQVNEQKEQNEAKLDLLLIDSMKLKPFKANWQHGNVYAPKKVCMSIGHSREHVKSNEDKQQLYVTPVYDVKNDSTFQSFDLGPILVISQHQNDEHDEHDEHDEQRSSEKERVEETVAAPVANAEDREHETMNDDQNDQNVDNGTMQDDDNDDVEDEGESEEEDEEDDDDDDDLDLIDAFEENGDDEAEEEEQGEISVTQLVGMCTRDDLMEALYFTQHNINQEFFTYLKRLVDQRKLARKFAARRGKKIALAKKMLGTEVKEPGNIFVKFDLLGKCQTQPGDELYYTCLEAVDVTGTATVL